MSTTSVQNLEEKKPNGNPLASFAWFPPKVAFATQDEQEHVILLMRQHWVSNIGWILVSLFIGVLPFILFYLEGFAFSDDIVSLIGERTVPIVTLIWYLLLAGYIFTQFLHWYYNVYIVTSKRVVDVDYYGILHKNISEAELDKIQDITHNSVGTLALLFNYGRIRIQTAAGFSDIEFDKVPRPSEVHKIIGKILEETR